MSALNNIGGGARGFARSLRSIGVPPHFAIDLRGPTLLWAKSRWTLRGWRLVGWGREERASGESVNDFVERVVADCGVRGALVSVSVRHPDLKIQRLELPGLSERDARSVALRKLGEMRESFDEPVNAALVMGPKGETRAAWLMAVPAEFAEFSEQQWTSLGLSVGRIDSLHIAVGALTRLFEAPGERQLRAFLDFGPVHATCVLADHQGWVFSRDLSLKMTGDPASAADANARIATELRRTFHYVDGEMGLGRVQELVVSGDRKDLDPLVADLEGRLSIPTKLLGDAVEEGSAQGADPRAAVVIGLTLTTDLGGGSLLPRTAQRLRSAKRITLRLAASAAVLTLFVISGAARFASNHWMLGGERERLEQEWLDNEESRLRVERDAGAHRLGAAIERTADAVFAPRPDWLESIEAVGMLLPQNSVLKSWNSEYRDQRFSGGLELDFTSADFAEATEAISQFRSALAEAPHWRVVDVERRKAPRGHSDSQNVHTRVRLEVEQAPVSRPTQLAPEVLGHG